MIETMVSLTVKSMHLISLTAPKHPKNASKQTRADVITSTYTAPEKRFVPSNSLRKLRSISVINPITNTIAPPSYTNAITREEKK